MAVSILKVRRIVAVSAIGIGIARRIGETATGDTDVTIRRTGCGRREGGGVAGTTATEITLSVPPLTILYTVDIKISGCFREGKGDGGSLTGLEAGDITGQRNSRYGGIPHKGKGGTWCTDITGGVGLADIHGVAAIDRCETVSPVGTIGTAFNPRPGFHTSQRSVPSVSLSVALLPLSVVKLSVGATGIAVSMLKVSALLLSAPSVLALPAASVKRPLATLR